MQYFQFATSVTHTARKKKAFELIFLSRKGLYKSYSNRPAFAIEEDTQLSNDKISNLKYNHNNLINELHDVSSNFESKRNRNLNFSDKDDGVRIESFKQNNNQPNGKPPLERILLVKDLLTKHLPNFLKERHPYRLYTADVIFENNFHEPGRTFIGATQYAIQLTIIRMKLNWKFSHAKFDILKITHCENEATIKIRWRVSGVGGLTSMAKFWKFNVADIKHTIKSESEWIDGFSILYLNQKGYIYKHTLERVMTQFDEDTKVKDKKIKNLAMNPTMCSN